MNCHVVEIIKRVLISVCLAASVIYILKSAGEAAPYEPGPSVSSSVEIVAIGPAPAGFYASELGLNQRCQLCAEAIAIGHMRDLGGPERVEQIACGMGRVFVAISISSATISICRECAARLTYVSNLARGPGMRGLRL